MKPNAYAADCPTRQILDRVGDKWAVLILLLLRNEPMRFNALRRAIEGISQKMLAQVLRSLERDGLVRRRVIATVPVTVEYSILPLGATLAAAVDPLRDWAERNLKACRADGPHIWRHCQLCCGYVPLSDGQPGRRRER